MKKYFITSVVKAQQNFIEKNYDWLKETYIRGGYDSKILFANYCIQRFEEDYLNYERRRLDQESQYQHQPNF